MKSWILYGPKDMHLEDMPVPSPGAGEVLLKVHSVGVCASDIHWYRDARIGDAVATEPLIIGHEFSGEVVEIGIGVTNVKAGDRVAVEPTVPCMTCDMCEAGNYNVCRNIRFAGTAPVDGAFREYVVWPARCLVPVPDSMSLGEAAMLEPLGVGMYAVDMAGDVRDKRIGILGSGAIGLSVLQCALAAGCTDAMVTDFIPERLEAARSMGASQSFDASDPDLVQRMMDETGGRGFDIVFEAAGDNGAVQQAVRIVKPLGTVVLIGIPDDDKLTVSHSIVRRKGLRLQFVRRSNKTLERCVEMVADGKADVASYITHRLPLQRTLEAFDIAAERRDGVLRVVVEAG